MTVTLSGSGCVSHALKKHYVISCLTFFYYLIVGSVKTKTVAYFPFLVSGINCLQL